MQNLYINVYISQNTTKAFFSVAGVYTLGDYYKVSLYPLKLKYEIPDMLIPLAS